MLIKSDLSQIQQIVDSSIETKIRRVVREEATKIVHSITRQIVQEELTPVKKDIKSIKTSVRRIDKTLSVAIKRFYEEDVRLKKRVIRIEEHLGLST